MFDFLALRQIEFEQGDVALQIFGKSGDWTRDDQGLGGLFEVASDVAEQPDHFLRREERL